MGDHFYLTLPSDAYVNYYPGNTASHFVAKLPERVRLEGNYEVGLSEFIYPHTWNNVDNRKQKYWVGVLGSGELFGGIAYVKTGYYRDGNAFASSLTHQLTRAFADLAGILVKVTFLERTGRIRIQSETSPPFNDILLSRELARFMGFREALVPYGKVDVTGHAAFDVNRKTNLMYVYCDVATDSAIGGAKAPLLRVCNVSGEHGRAVHVVYVRPHYVSVGRREFDTVKISINNEAGRPMPFEFGKSVVVLHFRRQ
jgi:hypothetical protein